MPRSEKRTVSLPKQRDEAIERWLREEVAPTYDAVKADPSRIRPAKVVLEELRAHHAARLRDDT